MKEYSQLLKLISVFMISFLLIQLTGCYSFKIISNSELPDSIKYHYIIYSQNLTKFPLENPKISNGILSGKLIEFKHSYKINSVHIYLSSDSVIKIDTLKNILSISLDGIAQVKKPKFAIVKTISLIAGCYISLLVLFLITPGSLNLNF